MTRDSAQPAQPTRPEPRPVIVFDGACGFCRRSVARARRWTGDAVEYLPSQSPECATRFPFLDPGRLAESVHLVEAGGRVTRGAEAVLRALAADQRHTAGWWVYRRLPGVAWFLEWAYRRVARNRRFFSWLTRPWLRDED